jgi:hypothetical protein
LGNKEIIRAVQKRFYYPKDGKRFPIRILKYKKDHKPKEGATHEKINRRI